MKEVLTCFLWRTQFFTFHFSLMVPVIYRNLTLFKAILSKVINFKINHGPNSNAFFVLPVPVGNKVKK